MLVDQAHEREKFLDEVMTYSLRLLHHRGSKLILSIYSAISQNKHKMEYEYNGNKANEPFSVNCILLVY